MTVGLHCIYLEVRPEDIAYIKFIFESYDGVGIIRTIDRKKAVIVLLVVDGLVLLARRILESLKRDVPFNEIAEPADIGNDWFMTELFAERACRGH
jgi:hypothetical protein